MNTKTSIAILQELEARYRRPNPVYTIETLLNTGNIQFSCTVQVGENTATSIASSKQQAKHDCAALMLEKLGHNLQLPSKPSDSTNYIGLLNEYASGKGVSYAKYEDCLRSGMFVQRCFFMDLPPVEGKGVNKKEAKQNAAKLMMEKLQNKDDVQSVEGAVSHESDSSNSSIVQLESGSSPSERIEQANYVGDLNIFAAINGMEYASYQEGPTDGNGFVMICSLRNFEPQSGYGKTKKAAKQEAAKNMLLLQPGYKLCEMTKKVDHRNQIDFDQLVEKFYKLSTTVNYNFSADHSYLPLNDSPPKNNDEILVYLEMNGYTPIISTFHKYPLILQLKIKDKDFVLLEHGDTHEKALYKLLNLCVLAIQIRSYK